MGIFGFRNSNTHGQTFTLEGDGITLQKIYVGYGTTKGAATATDVTLTVDAGNDGTAELTETFTLTTASITQVATAPHAGIHWLELDVSSSLLNLPAGTHSFRLTANSVTGATNTWLLAPVLHRRCRSLQPWKDGWDRQYSKRGWQGLQFRGEGHHAR